MLNIIPNSSEERSQKKTYLLAFLCLIAITCISHLLPGKIKVDVLYVCCVLLVVGQPVKRIVIYSIIASCLILLTHLTLNRTLPLSWVAFVNSGITISAALITSYFANSMLRENKLLEHSVAERTRHLSEVHNTLEESQSHLRTLFNSTGTAFLLLDSYLRIVTYNAIADHWSYQSFGTKLKGGSYFLDLLSKEHAGVVGHLMTAAIADKPVDYETSYPGLYGNTEWYRISMNAVKDRNNQTIGLCCSAINITLEKMTQTAHSQINEDLIQRNKDLEQFSYIVSHNLRAPLANITGLAQLLKQNKLSLNEKTEIENLLFHSIAKLNEIIDDLNHILQDQRQIEEKKEPVILSALFNDVITGFRPEIERENIRISVDFSEADTLFTIKDYLYNIFFNLVSNSIKYRQPNISVKMEIKSWMEDHKLVILFKDNGRGINFSVKGKEVFDLYNRFHPNVEGRGIGLFMVNSHVKTLGGDIDVHSRQNVGTTFIITLP